MELLGRTIQELKNISTIYTILAILAGVLVYFYTPYWLVRKVPGPPPLPLVGHLPLLAKYGPDVFTILAKKYGPIFRFHMGRQPLVIIADAEFCREVGIKKFKDFRNRSTPSPISASPMHLKGLFWTRDGRWSTMKNSILSFYKPSHLAKLLPTMQSLIESATQNLDSKGDLNFSDLSLKLATDVIGQAGFGVEFGLSKPKKVGRKESLDKNSGVEEFINQHIYSTTQLKMDTSSGSLSIILGWLVPILSEPFRQLLERVPGTMDWKIEKTNNNLSRQVDEIVAKRMGEEKGSDSKEDFLSLIVSSLEFERVSKNIFTQDYISALTYEHLLVGSATTSFTLSSIIYLVAGHPETEKQLIKEIDGFGPGDLVPSAHDLQTKFPYTDQVIKEAMRFYTLAPVIARETSAPVEIGGYNLPKVTWVWLGVGVLAKDPNNFPEPEKFRPERFDPNCEEAKKRHPYAHIPFGIGPRACIGEKFSLQEIKLSVIHLYRNYIFRHSPLMENPPEIEYGILRNFKNGVKIQAIPRSLM